MWDKELSVEYLDSHARAHSVSRCAEFVRSAIEAGGLRLLRQRSAKDYGKSLEICSFAIVESTFHAVGDVAVIQPATRAGHGHVAMFNGTHWVSDFKQLHGLYPGPEYRRVKPDFSIYRYLF
jgi:hypothetical protein